jgi:peptide/nickel transport system permease protein
VRVEILRLLLRYLLLAVALVVLNFAIPRFLPGSPLAGGAEGGLDLPLSEATRAQLRTSYRLDRPLTEQFVAYLGDLAHGDLGWSIARPAPVLDLILDRLPWTVGLLATALIVSSVLGTALGIAAGWSASRAGGQIVVAVAGALAAIPEFLVAIGLLVFFAVGLGWFPLMGGRTLFTIGHGAWFAGARDIAWHLTLPAVALVVTSASGFLLLARNAAAGARTAPWLAAARGKGLPEGLVLRRHALPHLALPLLTFFGVRLGAILGGALVVERVFSVPGLGLLAFQAIRARDYPVLQALFLLSGLAMLLCQFGVDVIALRLARRRGTVIGRA